MIKKRYFLVFAVLLTGRLFALDLTVIGGVGNFSFDNSSENPIGAGDFKGHYYPLGRITVTDQISDTFGYSATAERDPLLRNVLSCEMTINAGFFKLSVGPLFSLFNSWKTYIRPGVSTSLGLEFPGIFFINLGGSATFGSILENDYGLETSRIALGFWLPNLLSTLSLTTGKFNSFDSAYIKDQLLRISYRADIHAKNVPFTVSIEMGYQSLKRSYDSAADDVARQVYLGFETDISIKPNFALIFGTEIPVFVWCVPDMERAKGRWFFRAFTGFNWTIEKKE